MLLVAAGGGDAGRRAQGRSDRACVRQLFRSVTLCAIVTLWVLLLALLCAGYYQFTGNLRTARAALLPYIGDLANHTMSTLAHAIDETATMASDMMADGKMLSRRRCRRCSTPSTRASTWWRGWSGFAGAPDAQGELGRRLTECAVWNMVDWCDVPIEPPTGSPVG